MLAFSMKILLSAYSCLPNSGSEPGIGWNWAQGIAACGHQVVVITRANKRDIVEAECAASSISNPQFIFHDLSPALQKLYSLPFGNYAYYILWQFAAAKRAAQLHSAEKFDQVQHITWGSFRLPSFMGKLGVPFIFGPVAGGEDTPKKLRDGLGFRGRVWDFLRRISNFALARIPFMSATYSSATQIVATTRETLAEIPIAYRAKGRVQQAVGIDASGLHFPSERDGSTPQSPQRNGKLNLLFVGRLLPWKGLHLGLKALAALNSQGKDVHLTIIGSGSDELRLKNMAKRLKIADSVSWIPWMPREDLIGFYASFDLFLFPSLHDSGGMAVLEAMSLGLPVLCLDLGGPGESVDNSSGCVVATSSRTEAQVIQAIADFLKQVLHEPALLTQLSEGARRRVKSLSWEATVRSLYSENLVPQTK
jgi:glycosyltransferase involved in cell wall biosynthesis